MGVTRGAIGTAGHRHKRDVYILNEKLLNKKNIASPQSPSVFIDVLECNPYCISMMPVM